LNAPSAAQPTTLIGLLSIALLTGCASHDKAPAAARSSPDQPYTPQQVAAMRDVNVLGVAALYNPFDPWLWTESHEKPCGVVIPALYLMGANYRGVFGDGVIRPRLYVRELNDKGEVSWNLVKEWSFTTDEAIWFRSKKQSEMGWGYRLHLPWDGLADLAGKQIRMVVEFERIDGRKIFSDKKDFRVPHPSVS
jgi:hypothetical protein